MNQFKHFATLKLHVYTLNLCYFLICSLLTQVALKAQPKNTFIKDVTMPSPNAAALGKYGDIPVGSFTGTPSVNIPIASVQEGGLSAPITLNYHGSGVKISESASWVGLGFSLNAGGMITRSMRGLPDDHRYKGYYNNASSNFSVSPANTEFYYTEHGYSNGIDLESDLYSFNFLGYSGKFFFDRNKKVYFTSRQDLIVKVEHIDDVEDYFKSFTIITPDGTKYRFGLMSNESYSFSNNNPTGMPGIEVTKPYSPQPQSADKNIAYISSWYLRQISSHDDKYTINFEYETDDYAYNQGTSCSDYLTYYSSTNNELRLDRSLSASCDGDNVSFAADPSQLWEPGVGGEATKYYLCSWTKVRGSKLKTITNSSMTMTVEFGTGSRADIHSYPDEGTSGNKLENIKISFGAYCQKYNFEYDYFLDYRYPNNKESKRLQLTKVSQSNCDGTEVIGNYNFTYKGERKGSQNKIFLPHRLSPETDHWGYYNAASNNNHQSLQNMVPPTMLESTLHNGNKVNIDRASTINREQPQITSPSPMLMGALDKITYPTGGCTIFDYEPNEVYSQEISYENIVNLKSTEGSCDDTQESALTPPFTSNMIANGSLKIVLKCNMECNLNASHAKVKVEILDASNNVVTTLDHEIASCGTGPGNTQPYEHLLTGLLSAGNVYKFRMITTNGDATLMINHKVTQFINKKVGGLRAKTITSKVSDTDNNPVIKNYKYSLPTDATKSSGKLLIKPNYVYHTRINSTLANRYASLYAIAIAGSISELNDIGGFGISWADIFVFKSTPAVPLSDMTGYHMGYEYVVEELTNNGRKETKYYAEPYTYNADLTYPFALDFYNDRNGNVITEKIYDKDGILRKETENIPNLDDAILVTTNNRLAQTPGTLTPIIGCLNDTVQCARQAVLYSTYELRTNIYRVKKTITKLDGVTTETDYNYYTQSDYPLTLLGYRLK